MMQRLLRIIHSPGFRQSVVMTGGNLGGTAISAISLIIVSRALGPEDYGVFSTGFSLALFLTRVLDLGFSLSLQRQISKERGGSAQTKLVNGIQAVGILRLFLSVLCILAAFSLGPWLSRTIFHLPDPTAVSLSLGLCGITLMFDYVVMILQAKERFLLTGFLAVSQALLKLTSALILWSLNLITATSSLIFYLTAPIVGLIVGAKVFALEWFRKPVATTADLKLLSQTAKWISISLFSAAVAEHVDVLIIQSLLTTYDTGLFAAASRIAMFVSLLGLSLTTVLSIRVAKYHDPVNLNKYLKKAALIAITTGISCLVVIPLNPLLLNLTVGPQYLSAVPVLGLILVATAIATATTPYQALFYLFEKPVYYTYSGIILMVSLVAGDLMLIPVMGISGAAWSRIISRFLVFAFTLWYARLSYLEHLSSYAKS